MKKIHTCHKIVSILLVCVLLSVSAGNVYAGVPPFFLAPDTEHIQESEQPESPNAFIQLEKRMPFASLRWKRHEHPSSQKPPARTSGTSEHAESRRNFGRMLSILNFKFQQLVPTPRHHATVQLAQSDVASIPEGTITINQHFVLCAETSDDVAVAANHHLHQFQILLI